MTFSPFSFCASFWVSSSAASLSLLVFSAMSNLLLIPSSEWEMIDTVFFFSALETPYGCCLYIFYFIPQYVHGFFVSLSIFMFIKAMLTSFSGNYLIF